MTGNTSNTQADQFDNLPPVEAVRKWARSLVDARGDAHVNWLHEDGLRVDNIDPTLGEPTKLKRENVGTPSQGGTNIARCIQLATYPDADFAVPFWDHPGRTPRDVPRHSQGPYPARQYNEIHMPHPIQMPTLARVVMWYDWVPELDKGGIEVVEYTLLELEPEFQRRVAYANANRPTMEEWLRGGQKK